MSINLSRILDLFSKGLGAGAVVLVTGLACASPAPITVSGTVAHGQQIVISGAGFGSRVIAADGQSWKGSAMLSYRFKDFEDGSLQSAGFSPQRGGSNWSPAPSELGISTVAPPRNSAHYLRRTFQTVESGGLSATVNMQPTQIYTTFKFRVDPNTQSGKLWRFYGDSPQQNVYVSTGCQNFKVRGFSECSAGNCAGKTVEWGSGPDLTPGKWHRVEIWADAAGLFSVTVNGTTALSKNNWLAPSLGMQGHTIDYPNMLDSSARDASCPAVGAYNYDDIYVDFTRARVELADAPTWAAVSRKEVQIPVAWSDGSISVTVNSGEFLPGTVAYLYVVDAGGAFNVTGVPVSVGGTALAAPSAPVINSIQ